MAKAVIEMPPGDHQPQPPSDGAPSWCIHQCTNASLTRHLSTFHTAVGRL